MGTILLSMRRHLINPFITVEKYVPFIYLWGFFSGFGPEMEVFRQQWNRIPDLGLELPSRS